MIWFRLQFILQFVREEEDRKKSFLPRLHRPIFRVLKISNYTAACIIKAVSQLLPNYESRTWDAKTRKLLSYQIVISGKILPNFLFIGIQFERILSLPYACVSQT